MPSIIDSRFKVQDLAAMNAAVQAAQKDRATVAGPPRPSSLTTMQGVEKEAMDRLRLQRDQGPMRPMIVNGVPSFQAPPASAPVASGPKIPLPRAEASAPMVTRPGPPLNPLSRGAPAGAASSLGGPVPVGPRRAPGERALNMAARRGSVEAARTLFEAGRPDALETRRQAFEMWKESRADARDEVRFDREVATRREDKAELRNFYAWQAGQEAERRSAETASNRAYNEETRRRVRDEALADEARRNAEARKTYTLTDPTTGRPHTGHFLTGNGMTLPSQKPEAPLPPGMVPQQAERDGVVYGPEKPAKREVPDGIQYEKDINGNIKSAVYPVFNADTGKWGLARMDLNGDGVISPSEKAAAQAAPAANTPAKPGQTATGVKFKLKD